MGSGCPATFVPGPLTFHVSAYDYTCTTKILSVADQWYRYRFDNSNDSSDMAIYEGSVKIQITLMLLSHSSVSPSIGSGSAVITFQLACTKTINLAP